MPKVQCYSRIGLDDPRAQQQRTTGERYYYSTLHSRGYLLGAWYQDTISQGSRPLLQRPAGFRLGHEADKGDVILVASSAHAFRDTRDLLDTLRTWGLRGVTAHVLDMAIDSGTSAGLFALQAMAKGAALQTARRSTRARETAAVRRLQGLAVGGSVPYGFKLAGAKGRRRLVPDTATRKIGQRIVAMRAEGQTWHEVYFAFLHGGVRTRLGGEWSMGAILRAHAGETHLQNQEAAHHRKIATETWPLVNMGALANQA